VLAAGHKKFDSYLEELARQDDGLETSAMSHRAALIKAQRELANIENAKPKNKAGKEKQGRDAAEKRKEVAEHQKGLDTVESERTTIHERRKAREEYHISGAVTRAIKEARGAGEDATSEKDWKILNALDTRNTERQQSAKHIVHRDAQNRAVAKHEAITKDATKRGVTAQQAAARNLLTRSRITDPTRSEAFAIYQSMSQQKIRNDDIKKIIEATEKVQQEKLQAAQGGSGGQGGSAGGNANNKAAGKSSTTS
jgi:hypothetical protein